MKCAFCETEGHNLDNSGWKKSKFKLLMCRNCGNKFVFPLPTEKQLYQYYQNLYANRTEKHVERKESKFTNLYYRLIKKWSPQAKLIYEVGPSEGNLLYGLKRRGFEVLGYELSENSAKLGKEVFGIEIIAAPLPHKQKELADVLISSHVIEHLPNPREEFSAYANNLKGGGLAIITTPNAESLLFKIFKTHHPWFSPPDHLFYFDKKILSKDLERAGFQVLETESRNDKFSFLMLLVLSFLNYIREKIEPSRVERWENLLVKAEERPLLAKKIKSIIYIIADIIFFIFSKPIEFVLKFFDLNDEILVVAKKL